VLRKHGEIQEKSLPGKFRMSKKRIRSLWFWLGMLGMVLTMVHNVLLGEQSIFTAHDQLDGEMIAYLLQAKHLFSGDMLPEFMGKLFVWGLAGIGFIDMAGTYMCVYHVEEKLPRLLGWNHTLQRWTFDFAAKISGRI